jgi:hypothetical protein
MPTGKYIFNYHAAIYAELEEEIQSIDNEELG